MARAACAASSPSSSLLRAGIASPLGLPRTVAGATRDYVEQRPAAVRVLLVTPRGEPELIEATRRVQSQATAAIAGLLLSERQLLAGARNRRRRVELETEFFKHGLHGLAEWWAEHPDTPKGALVDAALAIAWSGLRSQVADQISASPRPRQSGGRSPTQ
jgi:hypothetical protein